MRHFKWALAVCGAVIFAWGCGSNSNNNPAPSSPSSPAPLCSSPSQHGVTTGFNGNLYLGSNTIYAKPVTLASTATGISAAVSLTPFTSYAISGQVWMAVYNDNGSGAPGDLIMSSVPQNAVTGWNTLDVTNITLPANTPTTYWVAMQQTGGYNLCPYDNAAGTLRYVTYTWAEFPPAFPSSTLQTASMQMVINTCP